MYRYCLDKKQAHKWQHKYPTLYIHVLILYLNFITLSQYKSDVEFVTN